MTRALSFVAMITCSLLLNIPTESRAADWPTAKTIRIVAPFAPAGVVDIVGRLLAEQLRLELGQSVIIENRAGAGGIAGSTQVQRAEPDGYTLLIGGLASHVIAPAIASQPTYDPIADFTHIAFLGGPPIALIASANSDLRSFADFTQAAKQGTLAGYASSGVGTLGHVLVEQLAKSQGFKLPHVPFNTAALNDIVAGRVPVGAFTFGAVLGQLQAGTVRLIAISSEVRHPDYPEVPTFRDLGYDVVATTWMSLDAPRGLAPEVLAKLNAATNKILSGQSFQARLKQDGIVPREMSPGELVEFYEAELKRWVPLARAAVAKAN